MPRSASRLRSAAPSSSAVDSRTVAKRQCSTSSSPLVGAEVGLGVADVDDEEHGREHNDRAPWPDQALRRPRLAPVRGRRAGAGAEGHRLRAGRPAAARARRGPARALRRRAPSRRSRFETGEKIVGSRAIMRAARGAGAPTRRCSRPTRTRARRCCGPRSWGDEVCSRSARRLLWPALPAPPARDGVLPGGRRAAGSRPWSCGVAAPLVTRVERRLNNASEDDGARRPARAARPPRPHRRAGSPTACSAASSPTPPTCRSARRRGCC